MRVAQLHGEMSGPILPPVAVSMPDQRNPCPVCGHPLAVLIADLPAGRLLQCGNCGVLDYVRRDASAAERIAS